MPEQKPLSASIKDFRSGVNTYGYIVGKIEKIYKPRDVTIKIGEQAGQQTTVQDIEMRDNSINSGELAMKISIWRPEVTFAEGEWWSMSGLTAKNYQGKISLSTSTKSELSKTTEPSGTPTPPQQKPTVQKPQATPQQNAPQTNTVSGSPQNNNVFQAIFALQSEVVKMNVKLDTIKTAIEMKIAEMNQTIMDQLKIMLNALNALISAVAPQVFQG